MRPLSLSVKLTAAASILGFGQNFAIQPKPNVLIIYSDDQGSLDLGSYGSKDISTPNLDALAHQGVRFTQFYAAPKSSPSRASLLTGQYTLHAGLWDNAGEKGLPLDKETLAQRLKSNGYATGLIGKWHLGELPEYGPNNRGFDYFFGFRGGCVDNYSHFFYWSGPNRHDLWRNNEEVFYPGQFLADLSVQEIKNFVHDKKDSPFFLYWAVNLPHYPMQGRTKWYEYYKSLPKSRRLYAAFVSTLDELVGEVVTFLRSENQLDNTIIIFQSDNGHSVEERAHFGGGNAGNYRGAKFSLFEGGIRIPAIISWPAKIPQNEVRDQLAMNVDWFPTILDLCKLPATNLDVDGKSLVPLLNQADAPTPHDILQFDSDNQWAVRKGDWKLISNPRDPVNPTSITDDDKLFLSNLKQDVSEKNNLAKKYPDVVAELLKLRKDYERKYNYSDKKP